jgi:hypothetical protein
VIVGGGGGNGEVRFALVAGVEGVVGCCGTRSGRTGFRNGRTTGTREGYNAEECLFPRFGVFRLIDDVSGVHDRAGSRRRGVWRELREVFISVSASDCRRGQWP